MNLPEDLARGGADSIRQGGPWAVLAVAMIAVVVTPTFYVGWKILPAVTDFVTASTETTQKNAETMQQMSGSMSKVHDAHASMMAAITDAHTNIKSNGDAIKLSVQNATEMLAMMTEAYEMMRDAPQQRAEQTALLQQIEQGIADLNKKLAEQAARAATP